jgi:hypothetical protein
MNPAAQPWILICIFCAGFCLWAAWQCRKATSQTLKNLLADQELFGPKRSRALDRVRQTVEWAEGHARMQQLIEDMRAGKSSSFSDNPEILRLAEEGVAARIRKEAELAAMTPEQREEDIRKWAEKLASEELGFDDRDVAGRGSWQKS